LTSGTARIERLSVILVSPEGTAPSPESLAHAFGLSDDVLVVGAEKAVADAKIRILPGEPAPIALMLARLASIELRRWRLWLCCDERLDPAARASVASIVAKGDESSAWRWAIEWRCWDRSVRSTPPGFPEVRLWAGDRPVLAVGPLGLSQARDRIAPRRAAGRVVFEPRGTSSQQIERANRFVSIATTHAVGDNAPTALGGWLLLRWLREWLGHGNWRRGAAGFVVTFMHHFWLPLLLNGRVRERFAEAS